MSWINPDLTLLNLENQIEEIGEYVGFYWSLIPSDSGIIISGSNNDYVVNSPNGNTTSYAHSSIQRNEPWSCSCVVGNNTYFVLGISTDLNANFPSPAVPSMKMLNYGFVFDTQSSITGAGYEVINGQISSSATNCPVGSVVSISYDGTNLKYFIDNVQVFSSVSTTLDPVYLVLSSFYGGSCSGITFTGAGGGGSGSTINLQEVLQNGNNANNLDIVNVGNLNINKYLQIGNLIGPKTSQIHLCWDTGNTTTGKNLQLVALDDGTGYSELQIQSYENNVLSGTWLKMKDDLNIFTNEVQSTSFTLSANNNPLLDAIINPPNYFFNINYTSGGDTKIFNTNTATSILSFDMGNLYSTYSARMDTLIFDLDVMSAPTPSGTITAQFYLTNVLNGQPTNDANFVSFTTGNLNPNVGGQNFNLPSSKVLCSTNTSNAKILYLNVIVKSTPTAPASYKLANFNIQMGGQASPSSSGNPVITMLT